MRTIGHSSILGDEPLLTQVVVFGLTIAAGIPQVELPPLLFASGRLITQFGAAVSHLVRPLGNRLRLRCQSSPHNEQKSRKQRLENHTCSLFCPLSLCSLPH